MKTIELDIFVYEKNDEILKELGVDVDDLDSTKWVTRKQKFYNIDSISEFISDDNKEYSSVFSGGFSFVCNLTYKQLDKKINDNL
jgi:hypothetical protein